MLEVRGLEIAFDTPNGPRPTVRDVSLSIAAGEIVGLVGESGCGKTLLSLAIMGLLPPNARTISGQVLVDGRDLLRMGVDERRRLCGRTMAMVFQDPMASLDPVFTCGSQIVEAINTHERVTREAAWARGEALLARVGLPDPARCMRAYPHEISGGQCQRVMIAMAVACKPAVIIADEPTTALDVTVQKQVLTLLRELNREVGAAILLITHDLGVVSETADRVIVMLDGRFVEEAAADDLFARPRSGYARALIESNPSFSLGKARLPVIERRTDGTLVSVMPDARERRAEAGPGPRTWTGGALLDIRGVCKTYWVRPAPFAPAPARAVHAVDNVSLSIPVRSTLGLVGESGCGKSTLSRLVMRLLRADGGGIVFKGQDLCVMDDAALRFVRRDIAMVFQNPYGALNPRQTVADLIRAPLDIHAVGTRMEREKRVEQLVDAVGLPRLAVRKYPHEFSGGQRQRIVIARALATQPSLVICDEAVSALDASVQAQVLNLLKDLQAEFDLTYLFISHDLNVVRHISDTIAVMRHGRIVETGDVHSVFDSPREAYTRELLEASPRIVRRSAPSSEGLGVPEACIGGGTVTA